MSLLIAGHDTTANQLDDFVYSLFTHPGQLAKLRADPGLVRGAVRELMRHTPLIVAAQPSVALEDVELSSGRIKAGETVYVDIAAANRDPLVFDRPDELDIIRKSRSRLGFRRWPAPLHLTTALNALYGRFPHLALVVPSQDVVWKREVCCAARKVCR